MVNTSFKIGFSDDYVLGESFWARIDVSPPQSDFVSLSDAAEVIDSIYDIDPCNSLSQGGEESTTISEEEVFDKLQAAFGSISYNPCKYDGNYAYNTTVAVFRSHLQYPYKLVINEGSIISTKRVQKRIDTLVLPQDRLISVDFPIVGDIVCSKEIQSYNGSQAMLVNDCNVNIAFSYMTEYDEVDVTVAGNGIEAQDAECIVFYKELAYSATISQPTEDADAIAALGCDSTGTRYVEVEDNPEEETEAPISVEPEIPHDDCWDYAEPNPVLHYEENCCEPWPFDGGPPSCLWRNQSWMGGRGIVKGADYYLQNSLTYETVILLGVSPQDGVCGTIETRYDVVKKNCCDSEFLTEIVYDIYDSVEIIADNSRGIVYWSGGQAPYTVTVRGQGFFADAYFSQQTITTNTQSAVVFTDYESCGMASVTITDGCSESSGDIMSTEGEWKLVGIGMEFCGAFKGMDGIFFNEVGLGNTYSADLGKYQCRQPIATLSVHSGGAWVPSEADCMYQLLCGRVGISNYCDYEFGYGTEGWDVWGTLVHPDNDDPPPPIEGYTMCYANLCQYCSTSPPTNCGDNPYQPGTCLRSFDFKAWVFNEPALWEWVC